VVVCVWGCICGVWMDVSGWLCGFACVLGCVWVWVVCGWQGVGECDGEGVWCVFVCVEIVWMCVLCGSVCVGVSVFVGVCACGCGCVMCVSVCVCVCGCVHACAQSY